MNLQISFFPPSEIEAILFKLFQAWTAKVIFPWRQ